jgi:subtilisin family serine protease
MLGLDYLRQKKDQLRLPMVVNISLGYHLGPHDGTGLLERKIQQVSGQGFVVVAANGNDGDKKVHGRIDALYSASQVGANLSAYDSLDVWYSGGSLKGEICYGSSCVSVNPGESKTASLDGCQVDVKNLYPSPLNSDGNLNAQVHCSGSFTLKLYPITGAPKVDIYVDSLYNIGEIEDYYLSDGIGGYLGTVAVPATSPYVISVGSISSSFCTQKSIDSLGYIAYFSSRGPTRDQRIKPDLTTAGYCVKTPMAGLTTYKDNSGTSFSAPAVAGLVAQILESNPNLDVNQVKNILISQALTDSATGFIPNNLYGYGKAFLNYIPSGGGDSGSNSGSSDSGVVVASSGGGGCSVSGSSNLFVSLFILSLMLFARRYSKSYFIVKG